VNIGSGITLMPHGGGAFAGIITAISFNGNGANLTNLNVSAAGWTQVDTTYAQSHNLSDMYGIYASGNDGDDISGARVGIGTSLPRYNLELGAPFSNYGATIGYAHTDLYVHNRSEFIGTMTVGDVSVTGILSSTNYKLNGSAGIISAGIVTTSTLIVGASGTAIQVTSGSLIGFGTASPRSKVDIDGRLRVKSLHENVEELDISSGNVNVDLSKGQSFNLNVDAAVTGFTVLNPPSEATAFTIKITQGSTAFSVGIDTFTNNATGAGATVYWPGGNVPIVTQTAGKTDIFSFKSFDSCIALFGIVGGQNFSN